MRIVIKRKLNQQIKILKSLHPRCHVFNFLSKFLTNTQRNKDIKQITSDKDYINPWHIKCPQETTGLKVSTQKSEKKRMII